MKRSTRASASSFHVSRWWVWAPLVPLLACGCKPREQGCAPDAIFEVLEPQRGAGAAPFSIERLGPEVDISALEDRLTGLTFTRGNRARVEWMLLGHIYSYSELAYSPAEGLARNVDHPDDVYPMKRFFDGKSERVRFGFREKVCLEVERDGALVSCKGNKYSEDERFLVAEMTCRLREK